MRPPIEGEPTDPVLIGDTWTWLTTLTDYVPGSWTLTYYFKKQDDSFSVAATQYGTTTSYLLTVLPATTSGRNSGRYRWWARVTDGTNSYTIREGELDVVPDPAAAGNFDFRTNAQKIVAALEDLALRRAGGRQEIVVDGVQLRFDSQADILTALSRWKGYVAAEQQADRIAKGLGSRRTIRVRV